MGVVIIFPDSFSNYWAALLRSSQYEHLIGRFNNAIDYALKIDY
jgi:hypothetical protein